MEGFLVFVGLIAGVIGLINSGQKAQKNTQTPKPTRTPSGGRQLTETRQVNEPVKTSEIPQQTDGQYAHHSFAGDVPAGELGKELSHHSFVGELSENVDEEKLEHHGFIVDPTKNLKDPRKIAKERVKKRLQKNLTKTRIVDAVLMSEILDKPRAKRPYRPVTYRRIK